MRALPHGDRSVILVITVCDKVEDLRAVLEAGSGNYIFKPVMRKLLNVRLQIAEERVQNCIAHRQADKLVRESLSQIKQEWESTADLLSEFICLLDDPQRIMRANRTVENWDFGQVTNVRG